MALHPGAAAATRLDACTLHEMGIVNAIFCCLLCDAAFCCHKWMSEYLQGMERSHNRQHDLRSTGAVLGSQAGRCYYNLGRRTSTPASISRAVPPQASQRCAMLDSNRKLYSVQI